MEEPEIFGLVRPRRLADFRFGDTTIASFAFTRDVRTVVITFRTVTETILERVEQFLRDASSDALDRDVQAIAEAFAMHAFDSHGVSSGDVMVGDDWSGTELVRVTVDLHRTTAAGIPIVTAVGAALINPDGEMWTEDQPRENAVLAWAPAY